MDTPELKQSKFQKICSKISKASFWVWLGTISAFVAIVIWMQKPENMKATPDWLVLGDIGLGVFTFCLAILSHFLSVPKTEEDKKSIKATLVFGVGLIGLFIVIAFVGKNPSGSVNGARLFTSPLPITTNATKTPQPTPTPKANMGAQTAKTKVEQIDCIGPDYKTFKTTAEACAKFRTDWGLPASATPWPTPQQNINKAPSNNTSSYTYVSPSYPPCTIYYPALGYSQTYYYTSPESCENSKKLLSTPTPAPTIVPTPTPIVVDNTAACNQVSVEWQSYKEQFYTTQYNNFNSSAEAIIYLSNVMSSYQSRMNSLGCNRTLGLY